MGCSLAKTVHDFRSGVSDPKRGADEDLVYGAGNIGSLYAGLLKESGQDVSILARETRFDDIGEHRIQLANVITGKETTVRLRADRHRPSPSGCGEARARVKRDVAALHQQRKQNDDATDDRARHSVLPGVLSRGF